MSITQLTVSEAAHATGLTRATARRCLLTLTELGYPTHDASAPLPAWRASAARTRAPTRCQGWRSRNWSRLAGRLGESISLAVLDEGEAVFVARAETERVVSAGVRIGVRLPACSTATGRVLLAALSDEELDALPSVRRLPRLHRRRPSAPSLARASRTAPKPSTSP
ncbi:helix-turn-helix domain-containing protein [Streptomyces sp. NPDC005917]|uniref:IclR family transcriptional regulator domain-containing protein n=1 Tax=Streptomyces sp. NPDC005917 TaxID=3155347 RepID=UPI0033C65B36